MKSDVANAVRAKRRARDEQLTPGQRVRQALALGQRDLRIFAAAQGLTLREARDVLRRHNQRGRRRSRANDG